MTPFNVYKHPTQGFQAVKVGFSWPAFFFGAIWMLVKKLWGLAGLWFAGYVVCALFEKFTDISDASGAKAPLYFLLAAAYLALWLVPPFWGNKWREENLTNRGYKLLSAVQAETPDAAVAQLGTTHSPAPYMAAVPVAAVHHNVVPPVGNATIQVPTVVDEDRIYATIGQELESGNTDKGLWTRLFVECEGDEKRIKIEYIKLRAERLIAAENLRLEHEARERAEEVAQNKILREESASIRRQNMALRARFEPNNITKELATEVSILSGSILGDHFINMLRSNRLPEVKALLAETPELVATRSSDGNDSPLHIAAARGYLKICELLLKNGALPNSKNGGGNTPLMIAKHNGSQAIAALITAVQ